MVASLMCHVRLDRKTGASASCKTTCGTRNHLTKNHTFQSAIKALQISTRVSRRVAQAWARTHHGGGWWRSHGTPSTSTASAPATPSVWKTARYRKVWVCGTGFEDCVFLPHWSSRHWASGSAIWLELACWCAHFGSPVGIDGTL